MLQMLSGLNDDYYRLGCDISYGKPIVWPDANRYLYEGFLCYFNAINIHAERSKIIFIDFRLSNLCVLLEQDWLVYFARKRVILVTDRYLLPLANHYRDIFSQIDSVIIGAGMQEDFFDKIDLVISGKKVMPSSKTCFSSREVFVLRMLTRGVTIQELAKKFHLSPKTLYTLRQNILDKMGLAKINDIFTRASFGFL